jgi:hypothetical protein
MKEGLTRIRSSAVSYTFLLAAVLVGIAMVFIRNAQAVDYSRYNIPTEACRGMAAQGYVIVASTPTNCTVRNGTGDYTSYMRFYDEGNYFCVNATDHLGNYILNPYCVPISQTNRPKTTTPTTPAKPTTPTKPVVPVKPKTQQEIAEQQPTLRFPFNTMKLTDFGSLPRGVPVRAGNGERMEVTLNDGSKVLVDSNATFIPVSDTEVDDVFGRFRHLWKPFHDGKCIVNNNLARQACRTVKTNHAILSVKQTEFTVDTDASGTTVNVFEGLLAVSDLKWKKTIDVAAGQTTFIPKNGLPEDPKPIDPAKLDRWWEQKPISQTLLNAAGIACAAFVVFMLIAFAAKTLFRIGKKKPVLPLIGAAQEKIAALHNGKKDKKRKPRKFRWFKL